MWCRCTRWYTVFCHQIELIIFISSAIAISRFLIVQAISLRTNGLAKGHSYTPICTSHLVFRNETKPNRQRIICKLRVCNSISNKQTINMLIDIKHEHERWMDGESARLNSEVRCWRRRLNDWCEQNAENATCDVCALRKSISFAIFHCIIDFPLGNDVKKLKKIRN